jgi:hypothetical protein
MFFGILGIPLFLNRLFLAEYLESVDVKVPLFNLSFNLGVDLFHCLIILINCERFTDLV